MKQTESRKKVDYKQVLRDAHALSEKADPLISHASETLNKSQNLKEIQQVNIQAQQNLHASLTQDQTSLSCIKEALDNKVADEDALKYAAISFSIFQKYQVPPLEEIKKVNRIVDNLASWFYWGSSYFSQKGPFAEKTPWGAIVAFFRNLSPGKHEFIDPIRRFEDENIHKQSLEEATKGALEGAGIPKKLIGPSAV